MGRPEARYDRELLLEAAALARSKLQRRRAIALYRQILAMERTSIEIHERIAPLLAETGQEFDAWLSYRAVAHAALREGREDRAIAVFREATRAIPREIQTWQGLARLLVRQGQDEDAVEVLVEGSRHFRAQWARPQAIHLLRRARTIDPWNFETVLELVRHLAKSDQGVEARMLLDGLAERCHGSRLRRVNSVRLTIDPGPRSAARWIAGWLKGDGPSAAPQLEAWAPDVVPIQRAAPSDLPAVRAAREEPGATMAADEDQAREAPGEPAKRIHIVS
jgi:tetratricopeptide (TPR) repeat protein